MAALRRRRRTLLVGLAEGGVAYGPLHRALTPPTQRLLKRLIAAGMVQVESRSP